MGLGNRPEQVIQAPLGLLAVGFGHGFVGDPAYGGRQILAEARPALRRVEGPVGQDLGPEHVDQGLVAVQLGPAGITANAIAPITTLTPRVAALRTKEDVERIASQVPLKRLATPEDSAQAMLFLASDAAAYLNGVALDVNGGRIMM